VKEWSEFLLQFGVSGAALGILGLYIWIHGRREHSAAELWKQEADTRSRHETELLEVIRNNTRALERNTETMAVVRDRL
jgi:hypothetical protein